MKANWNKPASLVLPACRSTDTLLCRAQVSLPEKTRRRLWEMTVDAKCRNQLSLARHLSPGARELADMERITAGKNPAKESTVARFFWRVYGAAVCPRESAADRAFVRNPKSDGLNSLLNYGYAVLLSTVLQKLFGVGAGPGGVGQSFLHFSRLPAFREEMGRPRTRNRRSRTKCWGMQMLAGAGGQRSQLRRCQSQTGGAWRVMIPMRDIKRYCDAIAAAFQPQKIILFGSYAYGKPNEDSDVDVMVVMPKKRYRRDLSLKVRVKVPAGFPVDILVEPDDRLALRIADRECFILDITEKGKVMYEALHA